MLDRNNVRVRARSLVTERGAYCHISSLINRITTVLFTVEGSSIYRGVLRNDSRRAPGRVKGQTAAVGCGAADSHADSDLSQPSHGRLPSP